MVTCAQCTWPCQLSADANAYQSGLVLIIMMLLLLVWLLWMMLVHDILEYHSSVIIIIEVRKVCVCACVYQTNIIVMLLVYRYDFMKCTRALVAVTSRAELVGKGIQLQMIIITDWFNFSMQIGYWLVYILVLPYVLHISLFFGFFCFRPFVLCLFL